MSCNILIMGVLMSDAESKKAQELTLFSHLHNVGRALYYSRK